MTIFNYITVFFFGTLWGSFFYTLAHRFSSGAFESGWVKALFSSSRCTHCSTPIKPLNLVPLLGYITSVGRCSSCGKKISPGYPISEIFYGFLAVFIAHKLHITVYAGIIYLIICIAITISIIDVKSMIIPTSLVIVLLLFSLYPIILQENYIDNLYGFLLAFIFFVVILLLFPGSFGGGDVKLASVIGLLLGLELTIVALETALISGTITGIIYAVKTKQGMRVKIPFAPFLTTGLVVALIYGREIVLIYYHNFQ